MFRVWLCYYAVWTLALSSRIAVVSSFNPLAAAVSVVNGKSSSTPQVETKPRYLLQPKDVVTKVAVAGATGRTGRVVVEELLNRGVKDVVALVRDPITAKEVFADPPENLQIIKCDLSNEREVKKGTHKNTL